MSFKIFLLFILNHIVFDFVFQGEKTIKKRFPKEASIKDTKAFKRKIRETIIGNIIHSFFQLLGMIIILCVVKSITYIDYKLFIMAIVIALLHFLIDEGKSILVLYKNAYKNNIWVFLIDQFIHLFIISIITLNLKNNNIYKVKLDLIDKLLITFIVFLIVTIVTAVFIKIFINDMMDEKKSVNKVEFNNDYNSEKGAKNGGFIIGILERILIFISMIIDYYSIIGFILTAKSIARFNKLSDQSFAEYFIIGNLISFTSAIIGGIFIKYILGI